MISISLTSGRLPRSFLSLAPRSFAVSTSGTSSGGSLQAALPGEDFSKISPSFWLTCVMAFRIVDFIICRVLNPEFRFPPGAPSRCRGRGRKRRCRRTGNALHPRGGPNADRARRASPGHLFHFLLGGADRPLALGDQPDGGIDGRPRRQFG